MSIGAFVGVVMPELLALVPPVDDAVSNIVDIGGVVDANFLVFLAVFIMVSDLLMLVDVLVFYKM